MFTIKPEILKKWKRRDGTFNVKIRITKGRKCVRLSTSLFVTDKDLDCQGNIKNSCKLKIEVDKLILDYQEKAIQYVSEHPNGSVDDIADYIRGKDKQKQEIDYISFCRGWIAKTEIKRADIYKTALNSFIRYLGKEKININSMDAQMMESFQEYLVREKEIREDKLKEAGKRIPTNRTLSLYLMCIKKMFNEAKGHYNRQHKDVQLVTSNPFDRLKIPRQGATRKRAVSPIIINKIWRLPYKHLSKGPKQTCRFDLAKDCFILSFCLMGMNSVDLYYAKNLVGNKLIYNRAKTKDRRLDNARMEVVVPSIVSTLLAKYKDETGKRLFNFYQYYATSKSFNKAINSGLKEIGEILGIDDLEFYAARHSWATIALNKCKIDKYTVHSALNHVDPSMRVTDIYIERDFKRENEANKKVIKNVFHN